MAHLETLALPRPAHRRSVWARLRAMMSLSRQRRDLSQLDAHLLRDVGLTAQEARTEAARPVWDAPDHWMR